MSPSAWPPKARNLRVILDFSLFSHHFHYAQPYFYNKSLYYNLKLLKAFIFVLLTILEKVFKYRLSFSFPALTYQVFISHLAYFNCFQDNLPPFGFGSSPFSHTVACDLLGMQIWSSLWYWSTGLNGSSWPRV